jgi:hypothetical protein
MNVGNLNPDEVKQLQILLNKMNPQPLEDMWDNSLDKMIDEIIENFDFGKVQTVMFKLNWQWAGEGVPTIESLKERAIYLLKGAAESRLDDFKDEHWEQGIICATGGFQATAYCDEDKTKITGLDLKFILTEWDAEIEN